MKSISDLKSDVINNFKRNPHLYKLTEIKDTDAQVALPDSGRIKPISAKEAKAEGFNMDDHARAVKEFNAWRDVRTAPAKLEKAKKALAEAEKLMARLEAEHDEVVIPLDEHKDAA